MVGGVAGETHFVGDHQHGRSGIRQGFDNGEHAVHHFRIESRCRLIQHQQFWIHGDRARNGHALLLTTGQFARISVRESGHAHPVEFVICDSYGFFPAFSLGVDQADGHIVQNRSVQKQIVILEHKTDFRADRSDILWLGAGEGHRAFSEVDGASVGGLKKVNRSQQSGFPGSAWTDNRDNATFRNVQVDAVKH